MQFIVEVESEPVFVLDSVCLRRRYDDIFLACLSFESQRHLVTQTAIGRIAFLWLRPFLNFFLASRKFKHLEHENVVSLSKRIFFVFSFRINHPTVFLTQGNKQIAVNRRLEKILGIFSKPLKRHFIAFYREATRSLLCPVGIEEYAYPIIREIINDEEVIVDSAPFFVVDQEGTIVFIINVELFLGFQLFNIRFNCFNFVFII
jgi:hypothetical protein